MPSPCHYRSSVAVCSCETGLAAIQVARVSATAINVARSPPHNARMPQPALISSPGVEISGRLAHGRCCSASAMAGAIAIGMTSVISSCTREDVGEFAVVALRPDVFTDVRLD